MPRAVGDDAVEDGDVRLEPLDLGRILRGLLAGDLRRGIELAVLQVDPLLGDAGTDRAQRDQDPDLTPICMMRLLLSVSSA